MPSGSVEDKEEREAEYPLDPGAIEARRQRQWSEAAAFAAPAGDDRPACYVLASAPSAAGDLRGSLIADAYARFRRAQGDAVLFSFGFDAFGPQAAIAAAQTRARLERLGCSADWERSAVSSDPERYRWTQWLFLAMLDRGLIQRRGKDWLLRIGAYAAQMERSAAELPGWGEEEAAAQRDVLGRIDGVELDAQVLGGSTLPVFTLHPDSVAEATFVAISPNHPEADGLASDPRAAAAIERAREAVAAGDRQVRPGLLVQTGMQASVPGVEALLPLVVSHLVDARYGPAAVLGIPSLDEFDRAVDGYLGKGMAMPFKVTKSAGGSRPASLYLAPDLPVSRRTDLGAPIPLVRCERCGDVPVPRDQLPVRLPAELQTSAEGMSLEGHSEFARCACPACGGPASRETAMIDPRLDRMWTWLAIAAPPEEANGAGLGGAAARWLPARRIVWSTAAAPEIFEQRLLARVLADLGELAPLDGGEPFAASLMHGDLHVEEPDELVERVGADAVRLAVLSAASPGTDFAWNEEPVAHCGGFLARLWTYAEPRLGAWDGPGDGRIDRSTKLRRRLTIWCRVGLEKVAGSLERLQMQRATRNAMLMLDRIEDFEDRAAAEAELGPEDRAAVVAALTMLVQAMAPFAPHICEELWETAGAPVPLAEAPWPQP